MSILRDSQRIERAFPARLLWWCCKLMEEGETDDNGETCRMLAASFDNIVQAQFADLTGADRKKVWARFIRTFNAGQDPLLADETHVGHVLVAVRVIVQRVWNAGVYEPDELFLAAWDLMSERVYSITDNGRCLNKVEAEAEAIAHRIVDRLHHDLGLWRDLYRNEQVAA